MKKTIINQTLNLGQILMTQGVRLGVSQQEIKIALNRHKSCDWGDVGVVDWEMNNGATIRNDTRIVSKYSTEDDTDFWIITEADRYATTILFPHEY